MTPAAAEGQVRASIARRAGEIRETLAAGRRTRLVAIGAAAFCLLAGGYLAIHRQDASRLREAGELQAGGSQAEAARESEQISRRPAETRALLVRAQALQAAGQRMAATRAFALAADRDPRNWLVRRDWAVALLAIGKRGQAARQMGIALELNPRLELPPGFTR